MAIAARPLLARKKSGEYNSWVRSSIPDHPPPALGPLHVPPSNGDRRLITKIRREPDEYRTAYPERVQIFISVHTRGLFLENDFLIGSSPSTYNHLFSIRPNLNGFFAFRAGYRTVTDHSELAHNTSALRAAEHFTFFLLKQHTGHESYLPVFFLYPQSSFRMTVMATPWILHSVSFTRISSMSGFSGCKTMYSPSR